MIQEIFPHRFGNRYLADKPMGANDFVLHYDENSLLLKETDNKYEIPQRKDFSRLSEKTDHIFLFTLNDVSCFLLREKPQAEKEFFVYKEIGFFRTTSQKEIAWVSIVGLQLMNWYAQNRFCGKCGLAMQHKTDERALICPECNTIVFPKISPAIIVAIVCDDKILLARNANFPVNWYSLIAGYADVGETLEETLVREVKEEVGLDIFNIRYYKSQPWPLSGSMMIGFVAEADDKQPICIDNNEIAEAGWYCRGNLPPHPSDISIAGEMIGKFEKGML